MTLPPPERAYFQFLQAYEDAIAFRTIRTRLFSSECPDCEPGQKCDDHAADDSLIRSYQARLFAARAERETLSPWFVPPDPGGTGGVPGR